MKQRQRFVFNRGREKVDSFLLLPHEVEEFLDVGERVNEAYAFERITGIDPTSVQNIALKVTYLVSNKDSQNEVQSV